MVKINKIIKHPLYVKQLDNISNLNYLSWQLLSNKVILIIGATGMVGSCLVDAIMHRNKYYGSNINLIAVSRNLERAKERFSNYWDLKNFKYVQHDCSKEFPNTIGRVDFAIHAASNTHPVAYSNDPVGTITTNVFGTYYLLEYLKNQLDCRVLFVSSVEIYGENNTDKESFSENDCGYIDCNTMRAGYPESKRVSESLSQAYISKFNMNIVIARLCRVFGPTMLDTDSKALSQFIKKAVNGEDIVLKSEGKQYFSFIYVFDAVTALLTIPLNGETGHAYNIADEKSNITLKELAAIIAQISNNKVIYAIPEKLEQKGYSKATRALLNSNKLKYLDWFCSHKIEENLIDNLKILMDCKKNEK